MRIVKLIIVTSFLSVFSVVNAGSEPTAPSSTMTISEAPPSEAHADYFVSWDTVIIGCTAGAAAGALAGGIPLTSALTTGVGIPLSMELLIDLTGLGCVVGAASGGVAILTAWVLNQIH